MPFMPLVPLGTGTIVPSVQRMTAPPSIVLTEQEVPFVPACPGEPLPPEQPAMSAMASAAPEQSACDRLAFLMTSPRVLRLVSAGRARSWPLQLADIAAQILRAVVEELGGVVEVVRPGSRVVLGELEVQRRLGERGRPRLEAVGRDSFGGAAGLVAVGIDEEEGVGVGRVTEAGRGRRRLHRLQRGRRQAADLVGQRLHDVAVAVVVQRVDDADVPGVAVGVAVANAALAAPGVLDLEGVVALDGVMTGGALGPADV